jgi:hypothetical protein
VDCSANVTLLDSQLLLAQDILPAAYVLPLRACEGGIQRRVVYRERGKDMVRVTLLGLVVAAAKLRKKSWLSCWPRREAVKALWAALDSSLCLAAQ